MHTIRAISASEYWRFLEGHKDASYQQTPEWGEARRAQWQPELIGWFDGARAPVGAAVLRLRSLPGTGRRFAYLPQGPLLDWSSPWVPDQLRALEEHLQARGVFGARITPPVSLRHWSAAAVRAGLTDPQARRISDLPPTGTGSVGAGLVAALSDRGWRASGEDEHADASHPRFNFWLPLGGRTEDDVLAGMTKAWRKNVRKADRAGVEVCAGSGADLGEVQRLYDETARRNGFPAQPPEYFEAMWEFLGDGFAGRFRLLVARHEGRPLAASGTAQVGGRAQGVFAATSTQHPQLKPSNALYWAIIRQALADGADLFDLGGVDDTLDELQPAAGLVRFKADMGAEAHEYIGAWDLPLQPRLYAAFTRLLPLYAETTSRLRSAAGVLRGRRRRTP